MKSYESSLYITADRISEQSGGGLVTWHESEALKSIGQCDIWDRSKIECINKEEPWGWDSGMLFQKDRISAPPIKKLAHFYAGTFTSIIGWLKQTGVKVSYTAAAHNVETSRKAHQELGLSFNYPHLTDPELWKRYVGGYLAADVVICPSKHSADCMRSYGCKRIEVIPHGVDIPEKVTEPPKRFVVGALGSIGAPDKGIRTLLQAWKKLNYKDATLVLAGRDSTSDWVQHLVREYGGGAIELAGWQNKVADYYNRISLHIQPSLSEGFGIEVAEAFAHGRQVVCSDGAGAADIVPAGWVFRAGDVDGLVTRIDMARGNSRNDRDCKFFLGEDSSKIRKNMVGATEMTQKLIGLKFLLKDSPCGFLQIVLPEADAKTLVSAWMHGGTNIVGSYDKPEGTWGVNLTNVSAIHSFDPSQSQPTQPAQPIQPGSVPIPGVPRWSGGLN